MTDVKKVNQPIQPLNSTEARNADSVTTSSPHRGIPEPTGKNVSADNPLTPLKPHTDESHESHEHDELKEDDSFKNDNPKMKLLREINDILEDFGGETNVPLGHAYWNLIAQYRSMKSKDAHRTRIDSTNKSDLPNETIREMDESEKIKTGELDKTVKIDEKKESDKKENK